MADLTYDDLLDIQRRLDAGAATIEAEATRYTLIQLTDALRMTRGMLQAIADGWTQQQLLAQPPQVASGTTPETSAANEGDRWSATQMITHLVATENWYLLHMDRLLGRRREFALMPRGLGDHARQDMTKEEAAAMLRAATDQILSDLESIPADADIEARRSSTYFGDLSLRGWALLAVGHDLDHLAQIQRLTDLPDFPVSSES